MAGVVDSNCRFWGR